MLARMWRNWDPDHCWWEYKMDAATVENSMMIPQKFKPRLAYDPAIPLLGIYPKELRAGTQAVTCILVFIRALFTVAKRWKHPKYPLTGEWIKNGIYVQWNIIQP